LLGAIFTERLHRGGSSDFSSMAVLLGATLSVAAARSERLRQSTSSERNPTAPSHLAVLLGARLLLAAGYTERLRQSNSSAPSILLSVLLEATLLLAAG